MDPPVGGSALTHPSKLLILTGPPAVSAGHRTSVKIAWVIDLPTAVQ
jgi:hypothetical protein